MLLSHTRDLAEPEGGGPGGNLSKATGLLLRKRDRVTERERQNEREKERKRERERKREKER